MSRVRWTPDARADLARIDDFYAEIDADYADRIGDAAIAAADSLAESPLVAAVIEGLDARKWRVPKTPYILFVRIKGPTLEVLRVRHDREDWKPRP